MVVYVERLESGSLVVPSNFYSASAASFGTRAVIVFPKITSPVSTVGFPPSNSEKNIIGDRSCIHRNWKGEILKCRGFSDYSYEEQASSSPHPVFNLKQVKAWPGSSVEGGVVGYDFVFPGANTSYSRTPYKYGSSTMYMDSDLTWKGNLSNGVILVMDRQQYTNVRTSDNKILLVQYRVCLLEFSSFDVYGVPHRYRSKTLETSSTLVPFASRKPPDMVMPASTGYTSISASQFTTNWTTGGKWWEDKDSAYSYLLNFNSYYDTVFSYFPQSAIYEDLCVQAIQSARHVDINTGMFAKDLFELKSALKPFIALADGAQPKDLATAYLSWRYGATLTFSDGRKLVKSVQASLRNLVRTKLYDSCRSRQSGSGTLSRCNNDEYESLYTYKVYYTPRDDTFSKVVSALMSWDLFPSLSNVWDVIPYSFVVDWFVPIQNALERIDSRTYASVLNVICVCRSMRVATKLSSKTAELFYPTVGWNKEDTYAHLTFTRFSREITSVLDRPRFKVGQKPEFRNYAELTSIIVQNF